MKQERIVLEGVSKKFRIGFKKRQGALARCISTLSGREPKRIIWALTDISFTAKAGEFIGIIGLNGSGKSSLLRVIAGVYDQDKGTLKSNGRLISLINLFAGLAPRLPAKDNIYLCSVLFHFPIKIIKKRYNSIIKFAELEDFVNTKIYQYSRGMMKRLVFSIAIHCDPEIILIDEIFDVGDEKFQKKVVNKIQELVKKGTTVLLVSHRLNIIRKHCNQVIWLDKGKILKQGKPEEVIKAYLSFAKR